MGVRFSGSMVRDLRRLQRAQESVVNRVLMKAARQLAQSLEQNTPVLSGAMASEVVYGQNEYDDGVIIGYSKEVAWRVHFVELGTIHHPPQGFIQKTHDENIREILRLLEREIEREMRRL